MDINGPEDIQMKDFEGLNEILGQLTSLQEFSEKLSQATPEVNLEDSINISQDALFANPRFLCDSIMIQFDSMIELFNKYQIDATELNDLQRKLDLEFAKVRNLT